MLRPGEQDWFYQLLQGVPADKIKWAVVVFFFWGGVACLSADELTPAYAALMEQDSVYGLRVQRK